MVKKGAVAFLAKPFDDQELLDAIEAALVRNRRLVWERRRKRAGAGNSPDQRSDRTR